MDQASSLLLIGNVVGGVANIYLFWKQGGQRATKDLIDLQEKQIDTLKTDVDLGRQRNHDLANQIQVLSLAVGRLEGQSKEKDKKLEEYLSIIQNRNPDLESVLKSINDFMGMINDKLDRSYAGDEIVRKNLARKK